MEIILLLILSFNSFLLYKCLISIQEIENQNIRIFRNDFSCKELLKDISHEMNTTQRNISHLKDKIDELEKMLKQSDETMKSMKPNNWESIRNAFKKTSRNEINV